MTEQSWFVISNVLQDGVVFLYASKTSSDNIFLYNVNIFESSLWEIYISSK